MDNSFYFCLKFDFYGSSSIRSKRKVGFQHGIGCFAKKINQLLDLQELHLIALEIREQLKKDGLDQDDLLKDAKRRAWEKFKANQLKEVLR
jgi:hypothetical protein